MATRQEIIFTSTARTATPTAVVVDAHRFEGLLVVIDVTAVSVTPDVVFGLYYTDDLSSKELTLIESVSIATVQTVVLEVGPGLTSAANLVANKFLPSELIFRAVHGDADSITYTVAIHKLYNKPTN